MVSASVVHGKTNIGLVEYAKSKLKLPTIYMLSGFGRILTEDAIVNRIKNVKCAHTTRNKDIIYQGIGKYCFDCVGLIKGYLWEQKPGIVKYNIPAGSDQNVGGMYRSCIKKGSIHTMPDIPGLLVFTGNFGHVGIYIGMNEYGQREYIEATPGLGIWGVGKTNDDIRHWSFWGMYHLIEYIEEDEPVKVVTEPISSHYVVKKGDNLTKIAKKLKTNVDKLYSINKDIIGSNKNLIHVGQKLRIPG